MNFFKFQTSKGSPIAMISIRQIPPPIPGRGTTKKFFLNSLWGAWHPNLTPTPMSPELKWSSSGGTRPWKNFGNSFNGCRENRVWKKNWRPLAAKLEVVVVTWPNVSNEVDERENMKTLGLEIRRYSSFSKSRSAPLMGFHQKFCYIRMCDGQKHYYGVVLHKLLNTSVFSLRKKKGTNSKILLFAFVRHFPWG